MNTNDRKWIAWAIMIALILVSTITGLRFPIPPPPAIEQISAAGYTHFSGLVVAAPTTMATATPGTIINAAGLGALLEIQDALTPVARFNDGGGLTIVSGGLAVTAGGLTITAGGLDMTNDAITNIGAAGTDFSASGGLTLADAVVVSGGGVTLTGGLTVTNGGATVTAGGLTVTAGGATITAGGLDMTDDAVTNIGAAGTDFSGTGGLTLADALIVSANGIDVQAGSITMANDETISNGTDTVIDISNYFAFAEQTVVTVASLLPITPTGSYQPITSTAAISTSLTSAIADGVKNGQLLVLVNENASDAITIVDGANTKMGGDKVLTGGQGDTIYLMWDGADWLCIGYNDN